MIAATARSMPRSSPVRTVYTAPGHTAPGHARPGWGPTVGSTLGWVLMESPAVFGMALCWALGRHDPVGTVFLAAVDAGGNRSVEVSADFPDAGDPLGGGRCSTRGGWASLAPMV